MFFKTLISLTAVLLNCALLIRSEVEDPLVVICPSFESANKTVNLPIYAHIVKRYSSSTDYCSCTLTAIGNGKTVIIKCDFEFEKNVILNEQMFPFKKYKIGSAYVRMTNAKSVKVTSRFLSTWMDSPSSALDLWHCGKVLLEPTPNPHALQIFSEFKTFIGVGIIDCNINKLPSKFLRDRNRGALRFKDCQIGEIEAGFLHNIEEMRYMIMEDSIVDKVNTNVSSSGVIALSKREIHAWDGMELINTTFKQVFKNAFNITHKEEMEKVIIKNCHFGNLENGGLAVSGDINVAITNSSFSKLDSMAINVSVNGRITFTNNMIEESKLDSLFGITCRGEDDYFLQNNTIYLENKKEGFSAFKKECGTPEVLYLELKRNPVMEGMSGAMSSLVIIITLVILVALVGVAFWIHRNRILQQYQYKRSDTPLFPEGGIPDEEQRSTNKQYTVQLNDAENL